VKVTKPPVYDGIEKCRDALTKSVVARRKCSANSHSSAFDPNSACASLNLSPLTDPPNLPSG
jgi:hypothetical protein